MEFLFLIALIGLIPAVIASNKGRDFILWWFYGALFFIIALPHSLMIDANQQQLDNRQVQGGSKKCPHCGEFVRPEAKVCKHCGKSFGFPSEAGSMDDRPRRKCPVCAEWILAEAQVCRYCATPVKPIPLEPRDSGRLKQTEWTRSVVNNLLGNAEYSCGHTVAVTVRQGERPPALCPKCRADRECPECGQTDIPSHFDACPNCERAFVI